MTVRCLAGLPCRKIGLLDIRGAGTLGRRGPVQPHQLHRGHLPVGRVAGRVLVSAGKGNIQISLNHRTLYHTVKPAVPDEDVVAHGAEDSRHAEH